MLSMPDWAAGPRRHCAPRGRSLRAANGEAHAIENDAVGGHERKLMRAGAGDPEGRGGRRPEVGAVELPATPPRHSVGLEEDTLPRRQRFKPSRKPKPIDPPQVPTVETDASTPVPQPDPPSPSPRGRDAVIE